MKTIAYNFAKFDEIMEKLLENPNGAVLKELQKELNNFFKDSRCLEVLYTFNTDKVFFGMCVIPRVTAEKANKILATEDKVRFDEYFLEIDSKLIDLGLTPREMTAVVLHEVGHLINNSDPAEDVRHAMDVYLDENRENIRLSSAIEYAELMAFGIKLSVNKAYSIFDPTYDEVVADAFAVSCGYGNELASACKKICKSARTLNKDVPKFITLRWTLKIYKDIGVRRMAAIKNLTKCKMLTGSKLEQREIDSAMRSLRLAKPENVIRESAFEKLLDKSKSLYKQFKHKNMRGIEEDLYEYAMRVQSCDDEQEALSILRGINTRIAMIEDFMYNEKLDGDEKKKWCEILDRYNVLRDQLSKKATYRNKYYGLFVQTPEIKSRYSM